MIKDLYWRNNVRPDVPNSARVYDYLLGGKDNYQADRDLAHRLVATLPNVRVAMRWNRAYLKRAVSFLVAEAGIRQIIDIGAGLPTMENTHEVALVINPDVRVVYVDHDPVVLAHARDTLHNIPSTTIIEHDAKEPGQILADPMLTGLISFDEPVAVMMLGLLHFIADTDDPAGIIERLMYPFPAGSYLALSHGTCDAVPEVAEAETIYQGATEQVCIRSRAEIRRLIGTMTPVEPGLVWLPEWHPDPGAPMPDNVTESYYCALVARKPLTTRKP